MGNKNQPAPKKEKATDSKQEKVTALKQENAPALKQEDAKKDAVAEKLDLGDLLVFKLKENITNLATFRHFS